MSRPVNDSPHSLNIKAALRGEPGYLRCQCPHCRPLLEERRYGSMTPLEQAIEDILKEAGLGR